MTQGALGDRVGLTAATISDIEAGRSRPSLDKAIELAAVFNLPVEEVFSYVDVPTPGVAEALNS